MFGELMRWSPAEELSNWHRDIDDLFGRFQRPDSENSTFSNWTPRVETYRNDNDYVVRVDLPGVDPKDVHVEAEGNLLSITGERKAEEKGPEYRETFYGKFERRFTLPQGMDAGKISAHYEHGVLELRMPLPAQLAGRNIPIQMGQKEEKRKLESKVA
jgi:HSP20 family protein